MNGNGKGKGLFDLSGRNAVITGGGGAIGRTVAAALMDQGAAVALMDIREEPLNEAVGELSSLGRVVGLVGDVSRPESAAAAADAAISELESIDILFNNAGMGIHVAPEELGLDDWENVLRVNLTSTFLMSQRLGRHMIARGIRGSIVNTSSTSAALAMGRGNFAYSVAKAGVNQLTRELALEWGRFGIRVNAIEPCQVDTPGVQELMKQTGPGGEKLGDRLLKGIPLGRIAVTADLAGPAVFLASDASSMITGTCLPVDGGNLACSSVASIPLAAPA